MNGAEALVATAVDCGIDVCFANPGTTEMPLVAALDSIGGIRAVLGLHENVCSGAADGFGRMSGRPAMTLLHLGPGLANGVANLHNARRAGSPILNVVGEHASWHFASDPPLAMDIQALAGTASDQVVTTTSAAQVGAETVRAIAQACSYGGQVTSLVIPHDHQWGLDASRGAALAATPRSSVPGNRVEDLARLLNDGKKSLFVLGGDALSERGLAAAARVAVAAGCNLACETFPARMERGLGRTRVERLPYFPEQAVEVFKQYQRVILVGLKPPVAFFAYEGMPSRLLDGFEDVVAFAGPHDDSAAALEDLASALGAGPAPSIDGAEIAAPDSGPLSVENITKLLVAAQPENAVVVETAATSALAYFSESDNAKPFSMLNLTGGAIGQGPPCATGAALACPDRKVINFQADGSAAFTIQALWSQAREGLDVTTLICSNRRYLILQFELMRAGIVEPGPKALQLTDLGNPDLDWVQISQGFGVPAVSVDNADDLSRELPRAIAEPGPQVIELILS